MVVAALLSLVACSPAPRDGDEETDAGEVEDAGDTQPDGGDTQPDGGTECVVARCEDGVATLCDGSATLDCGDLSAACTSFNTPEGDAAWCTCGDVTALGRCVDAKNSVQCQDGIASLGTCPPGSVCDVDASGVICVCDNVADELCPDPGCTDDPDCTPDCTPQCNGRVCGDDGCGGTCGACSGGKVCNGAGACVTSCTPQCSGLACGSDGCGGSCGSCGANAICAAGACQATPATTKLYPITSAGAAVDFAYTSNALYVVGLEGTRTLYKCALTGCSGTVTSPGTVASDVPLPILEASADKLFWLKSKTVLRETVHTTQATTTRVTASTGSITTGVFVGGANAFFGLDNRVTTPAVQRMPIASGDPIATSLETTSFNRIELASNDTALAFWQEASAASPLKVRTLSTGRNVTLGSVAGVRKLAIIGGDWLFWTKEEGTSGALYGCSIASGCTAPTLVKAPVWYTIATDGQRIFFNGTVGTTSGGEPAWGVLSCAPAEAIAGTCVPKVEAGGNALEWLGLRRLRVDASSIYGINQNGELRRSSRVP